MKLILACSPIQQRLGYVNGLITLTSPDSFTSREILSTKLFERVKDKQENWLKQARSTTGAITADTAGDIVDWVINLELLFPSTFTWRPDARLLDSLIGDEEYDAFHATSNYNPLNLSMPEKLFYLYRMLKSDGAALVYLMSNLNRKKTWTRKEAADFLPETYEEYGKYLLSTAQSTSEYTTAKEFIATAERMIKGARLGVVGTKELRATSRLEALVDIGIIDKPDNKKNSYVYTNNEFTKGFVDKFNDWMENERDLNQNFFERCAYIYKLNSKPASDEEIFRALVNNFEYLKAAYGLAGIDEVCLLSGIKILSSKTPKIVEINRARDILIGNQKKYQRDIKLHVDPRGRIRYFSVSKEFLVKYISESNTSELNE